ncbi:ABC transporter permease [Kocuria rosea]|uniref:ABC transporter permease n=1 Tax=Kocuria rosea TaxID=1275 RepID=UPI00253FBFCA|nr:ABC transporter permease [Kocuria rosea]WIG17784.1 ABC transporter permease [Kocuria rosea]
MYLSVRDLVFARGRFALIGGVVALITLLLVLLTGLTDGLGGRNTSALERLDADRMVFSAPADGSEQPSFPESGITDEQLRLWEDAAGGAAVERLGVAQSRAGAVGSGAAGVAVVGLEEGTALAPTLGAFEGDSRPAPGRAVLSETVAGDLGLSMGDAVRLSSTELIVAGIAADEHYSHVPVVWTSMTDFPAIAHLDGATGATVLAVPGGAPVPAEAAAAADEAAGTVSTDARGALAALPAYRSERGSLLMMQAFLYGISALVVVSFLTVWTIQRTRDIAVLRALGSSGGYVLRDSLAQAAVVLLAGVLAGGLAGLAGGLAAGTAVPFALTPATLLVPVLGVFVLGVAGALLATRRVSSVDPLLALGGN